MALPSHLEAIKWSLVCKKPYLITFIWNRFPLNLMCEGHLGYELVIPT